MTMAMRCQRWHIQRLALLLPILAASGCDEDFAPIDPAEQEYSIAGYLDASADTQWIRVMPMRAVIPTPPGPLDATVTLENVATGVTVELRDSIFEFPLSAELGSQTAYIHNYWTTSPIEPGAIYQFRAHRAGMATAEATVAIPPDYQIEVWLQQPWGAGTAGNDYLRIEGLENVAFVTTTIQYFDSCGSAVQRLYSPIPAAASDVYMVPISRVVPTRLQCMGDRSLWRGVPTLGRELWVVGSGEPWKKIEGAPGQPGLTEPSNISNSLGYIGGVLTKQIPYENCVLERYTATASHCVLRYLPASATLKGVVRDRNCGMTGLPRATVELRELNPPPPATARIRTVESNPDGSFEFGALEAGIRYQLSIFRDEIDDGSVQEYETYVEMFEFAPGETRLVEPPLRREVPCGWTGVKP